MAIVVIMDTAVATAHRAVVAVYRTPEGAVQRRLRSPWRYGAPLTFLVTGRRARWVRVLLPTRPNGAAGWVRTADVRLTTTRLELVVSRKAHVFRALRDGRVLLTGPVGVGRAGTPTPAGRFYVTAVLRTGDPAGGYGPYVLALSAHSGRLRHFAGGDGQIGVHGTDEPALLGHDISHGCIRIRNDQMTRLAHLLPRGTPVTVR